MKYSLDRDGRIIEQQSGLIVIELELDEHVIKISPHWLKEAGFQGNIIITKGMFDDAPQVDLEIR